MWRSGVPGAVGYAPCLAILGSGLMNIVYGAHSHSPQIQLVGAASALTGLGFVVMHIQLSGTQATRKSKTVALGALLAFMAVLVWFRAVGPPVAVDVVTGLSFNASGIWLLTAPLAQVVRGRPANASVAHMM